MKNAPAYTNLLVLSNIRAEGSVSAAKTCLKYGLTTELLEHILSLSDQQLDELANSDFVLFKPAVEPATFMRLLGVEDRKERKVLAGLSRH